VKKRFDDLVGRLVSRWVERVLGHSLAIIWAILALTVVLLAYTAMNLGINSDNVALLDEDLPSRVALDEFSKLFPILNNSMLVVVDAETPELARDSADELAEALALRTDLFSNAYIPGGGEFFERNGLLYRSVDDLYDFTDHMAEVQPILTTLERDASIANLCALIRTGLEHADSGPAAMAQWSAILDRFSDGASRVFDEYPLAISWEEFLLSGSSLSVAKRRVIIAEPILDFSRFLPGGPGLSAIRETAAELGLTPEHGVTVRVTGNPVLNYEEMIGIAWDIAGGGVFCFLFVALVLWFALRSMRITIAALATLIVGLVWTAAFATVAVGHLNLLSISFAVLFIGLGVDFAIHLGMDYGALRADGLDHRTAMHDATVYVGSSLLLCTITTCLGFYAFVPTDYLGVAELGLIAGTGMLIILFLTFTLFPAFLSTWLEIPVGQAPKTSLRFRSEAPNAILEHARSVRWIALIAGLAALVLAIPRLTFETNVIEMRNPKTESVQAFNDLAAMNDHGAPWFANALAPNLPAAIELAARFDEQELISHTVTLADYVPEDQEEKSEILADLALMIDNPPPKTSDENDLDPDEQLAALRSLRDFLAQTGLGEGDHLLQSSMGRLEEELDDFFARIDGGEDVTIALDNLEAVLLRQLPVHMTRLRNSLNPEPITLEDIPSEVVNRMIAPDGQARVIAYPAENLQSNSEGMRRFVDAAYAVTPDATGMSINTVEFGRATVRSLQQALVSAVAAIALLLTILWRRPTEMLLVMAPLTLGALLTCAGMVALGVSFNFANIIVIPLLLGIGVDSAIHLVHRADVGNEGEEGLLGTTTARAIFYSAFTTIASFGSLAFSSHRGLASLGVMLVVGLVFTLISTLVVLPALIEGRSRSSSR
jgi:hopanoid biosynthesis associated RND transporter like protein HpnN